MLHNDYATKDIQYPQYTSDTLDTLLALLTVLDTLTHEDMFIRLFLSEKIMFLSQNILSQRVYPLSVFTYLENNLRSSSIIVVIVIRWGVLCTRAPATRRTIATNTKGTRSLP